MQHLHAYMELFPLKFGGCFLDTAMQAVSQNFEKVRWFVYAHAPPEVDFIYISTGLLSDVHGYNEDSRARAACTCNGNFMIFSQRICRNAG